tara:strand:+ start:1245 stop:1454 length:210 start_codon:yes stop_codon:yes gene_type:complete
MEYKQDALDLVDEFKLYAYDGISSSYDNGVILALIHVNKLLNVLSEFSDYECLEEFMYQELVKNELEKL